MEKGGHAAVVEAAGSTLQLFLVLFMMKSVTSLEVLLLDSNVSSSEIRELILIKVFVLLIYTELPLDGRSDQQTVQPNRFLSLLSRMLLHKSIS